MTPNNNDTAFSRRNVLKSVGATATVGGLPLFSSRSVAAREPTGKPISPDDHEPPNPDVQVLKVAREVEEISARYPLLTLPEDTIVSYIRQSDLSQAEKREARQALADLRRRFPTKKVEDGNTTWFKLAEPDVVPDSDDAAKFETAHRAFADGASGRRSGFSTMHTQSLHRSQARDACEEIGLSSTDTDEIASYADDPDNPDVQLGVPDGIPHEKDIEDGLEYAFEEILHHYGQYYDTDAFEVWHDDDHSDDFGGLGGAPFAADWHMDNAYNSSGSTLNKYLGKATHYPSDMSVPLHTGMGWEQANLEIYWDGSQFTWDVNPMYWLHSEYEEYVMDNWTDGEWFKYYFGSDECSADYCYYPIDSVKQAIEDSAKESGEYSYDMYHHILDEGNEDWTYWDSTTLDYMANKTENVIDMAGLYIRGFIKEFY